jgi:regulatory protein
MKNAIDTALFFLKFRPRTVFEIRQKLQSKNISEEEIDKTVDVLIRNELLDDAKFAKMYVKDRNKLKPTGSYLLRLELKHLGIDENLIEDVMQSQDEEVLAQHAIEMKHRYRDAEYEKKAQFLSRRGFSTSIIYKILKEES